MMKLIAIILIVVQIHCVGCVSTQAVNTEYLSYDQSKSLRIELKDGRQIQMSSGKYQIINSPDTVKIIGSGTVADRSKGMPQTPFTGIIFSTDIAHLETVEPSVFAYSIPMYIGVVTAIGLMILISFHGSTVGG